jgi:hypothetical protein
MIVLFQKMVGSPQDKTWEDYAVSPHASTVGQITDDMVRTRTQGTFRAVEYDPIACRVTIHTFAVREERKLVAVSLDTV